MSLSESMLQSQIALNQNQIRMLHFWVDDAFSEMYQHIHHYKYYAGLKVEKEHIKRLSKGITKLLMRVSERLLITSNCRRLGRMSLRPFDSGKFCGNIV